MFIFNDGVDVCVWVLLLGENDRNVYKRALFISMSFLQIVFYFLIFFSCEKHQKYLLWGLGVGNRG